MLRGTRGYESRETRVIFIIPETEFIFPFLFSISFHTIRTIARDFVLTDECVLSLGRFYANFTLSPTHSASNLKLTWKLRVTNDKVFEQYFGNFREL